MDKLHWQTILESVGVPVSLAEQTAKILQKEAEDFRYKRTSSEQETVMNAWKWTIAQRNKVDE